MMFFQQSILFSFITSMMMMMMMMTMPMMTIQVYAFVPHGMPPLVDLHSSFHTAFPKLPQFFNVEPIQKQLQQHDVDSIMTSIGTSITTTTTTTTLLPTNPVFDILPTLFHTYQSALERHPLYTKMITGSILAVMGDAVAQKAQQTSTKGTNTADATATTTTATTTTATTTSVDTSSSSSLSSSYDTKRAVSFALFDMSYRALQHVLFPWITQHCHGTVLLSFTKFPMQVIHHAMSTTTTAITNAATAANAAATTTVSLLDTTSLDVSSLLSSSTTSTSSMLGAIIMMDHSFDGMLSLSAVAASSSSSSSLISFLSAMEGTMVNQFVVVPLVYYPVFFLLTALLQNLTLQQGIQRAQQMFLPLMKRNVMFWIPLQMIQFLYIPELYQIPFVSVVGFVWTIILSTVSSSSSSSSVASPVAASAIITNNNSNNNHVTPQPVQTEKEETTTTTTSDALSGRNNEESSSSTATATTTTVFGTPLLLGRRATALSARGPTNTKRTGEEEEPLL